MIFLLIFLLNISRVHACREYDKMRMIVVLIALKTSLNNARLLDIPDVLDERCTIVVLIDRSID